MEYDEPNSSMCYDDRILNDKLGMAFSDPTYKPSPAISLEQKIKESMIESSIIQEAVRRELNLQLRKDLLQAKSIEKDNILSGFENSPISGFENSTKKPDPRQPAQQQIQSQVQPEFYEELFDKTTLIFIMIILVIVCYLQWSHIQEISGGMHHMQQQVNTASSHPASIMIQ